MPLVDVIVLNYNGIKFLQPCLDALRAQTFQDFEILLVDNGSSDGSVNFVHENYPEVNVLALPGNLGFAGGNNRGIEATSGKYVALLNNDTEVEPGWLKALVDELENRREVGFCASKMIRMSDRLTIDTAGDLYFTNGVAGKRGFGEPETNFVEPRFIFGACAGAAIYRREMLNDIGVLDDDFFIYYEDVDLSFRAQLRGYLCLFVPSAVVYHHVSGFFKKHLGEQGRLTRRNMFEVVLKNMPFILLAKYGFLILIVMIYYDLYYIFRGDAKIVFSARWENVLRLRRTLAKRRIIQRRRTVSVNTIEKLLSPGGFAKLRIKAQRWICA